MKTAITYGTFDLFHIGHLRLLQRIKEIADRVIVGVSTDEFNAGKGKKTIVPFSDRIEIVRNIRYVSDVIPEERWEQKRTDIARFGASVFVMGDDWRGKFDDLGDLCHVVYLPRTEGISSTDIKRSLRLLDKAHVDDLKKSLDLIGAIVARLE